MSKFLNDYADEMNKAELDVLNSRKKLFLRTIQQIDDGINGRAFRPARSLNAAVFDAVMVGVATAIDSKKSPSAAKIAKAYDALLANNDFRKGWIRATADEENVKARMAAAVKAFSTI